MSLVQTAEFDLLPWQTKGYFFLHATFTVFWLNTAFIAVHSGERCAPWPLVFYLPQLFSLEFLGSVAIKLFSMSPTEIPFSFPF